MAKFGGATVLFELPTNLKSSSCINPRWDPRAPTCGFPLDRPLICLPRRKRVSSCNQLGSAYHATLGIGLVIEIVRRVREFGELPIAGTVREVLAVVLFIILLVHEIGELAEHWIGAGTPERRDNAPSSAALSRLIRGAAEASRKVLDGADVCFLRVRRQSAVRHILDHTPV